MTISTPVPTDYDLQAAVQAELEWTPEIDAARIGVAVDGGSVALSGQVDTYGERAAALHAAYRVRGVTTVVNDVAVHPSTSWTVSETDVAKQVVGALAAARNVPSSVRAEVTARRVTLTGVVAWEFERASAVRAVSQLSGVASVDNMITLSPRVSAADAEVRITAALVRNAQVDAATIDAAVTGTTVVLTGDVKSWSEKQAAASAAWASPHVTHVDNRITVRS